MSKNNTFSFIRYASCWEDSKILRKALQIKSGDVGVSIASAGDNTMALLLDDPAKIIAFDLNPTQLYCFKLKIAAIQNLEYEELLAFLGVKECKNRKEIYHRIKNTLEDEVREYFDLHLEFIEAGIIHVGKFEHYFHLFRKYITPLFTTKKILAHFLELDDPQKQKEYYLKYMYNRRLKAIFGIYFGSKVMGKLGRDKSFYRYVDTNQNIGMNIKERFEFGLFHTPNRNNPYLHYVLANNYSLEALPEYLKKENIEIIKQRLDRIEFVLGDLFSIQEGKYDFYNLSDIFEYMSNEDYLNNLEYIKKISNNKARIAYWNMQGNKYIQDESFLFQKEQSEALFIEDQAYFYKDFLVYHYLEK